MFMSITVYAGIYSPLYLGGENSFDKFSDLFGAVQSGLSYSFPVR